MVRYSEAPALGTFSPKQAELLSKKKKTELLALQEANRASKFIFQLVPHHIRLLWRLGAFQLVRLLQLSARITIYPLLFE